MTRFGTSITVATLLLFGCTADTQRGTCTLGVIGVEKVRAGNVVAYDPSQHSASIDDRYFSITDSSTGESILRIPSIHARYEFRLIESDLIKDTPIDLQENILSLVGQRPFRQKVRYHDEKIFSYPFFESERAYLLPDLLAVGNGLIYQAEIADRDVEKLLEGVPVTSLQDLFPLVLEDPCSVEEDTLSELAGLSLESVSRVRAECIRAGEGQVLYSRGDHWFLQPSERVAACNGALAGQN